MKDNISRSSIFRDSMRIEAEKKKEEREKNIKVAIIGKKKTKPTTLMQCIQKQQDKENKDIGKEPRE